MLQMVFYRVSALDRVILQEFYENQLQWLNYRCLSQVYEKTEEVAALLRNDVSIKTLIFLPINGSSINDINDLQGACNQQTMLVGLADDYQWGRVAFEYNIHYALQRPLDYQAMLRLNETIKLFAQNSHNIFLSISKGKKLVTDLKEIECFEMVERKVVMYREKQEIVIDESLVNLEQRLKKVGFIRTHTNYLVNVFAIKEIISNTIFTTSGYVVLIGADYKKQFKQYYYDFRH